MSKIQDIPVVYKYRGNGVTTAFQFNCMFWKDEDIVVYLGDEVITSGYTVSSADRDNGGTVTFDEAPAEDTKITIERVLSKARLTEYSESGTFRADPTNSEFNHIYGLLQQLSSVLSLCMKIKITDDTTPEEKLEELYQQIDDAIAAANEIRDSLVGIVEGYAREATAAAAAAEAAMTTAIASTAGLNEAKEFLDENFVGSYPVTFNGYASTEGQTTLELNLEDGLELTDNEQIISVIIENTALLPGEYGVDNGNIELINPLTLGERWSVKLLFSRQVMAMNGNGLVHVVEDEEIDGVKNFLKSPTMPTKAANDSSEAGANTEFVTRAITAIQQSLSDLITALDTAKAPLNSPALTGTPTAPTAATSVNNTQIATTAFAKSLHKAVTSMPGSPDENVFYYVKA